MIDELIRETLHDLAGEARPADMQARAVAAGRRLRRRRAVIATSAAAAVTALALVSTSLTVGGVVGVDSTGDDPNATTIGGRAVEIVRDDGRPVQLLDGWYLLGGSTATGATTRVLDWVHQRYVDVPATHAWPSPKGDMVAFADGKDNSAVKIWDFRTGVTSDGPLVTRDVGEPQWSPDGTKLLVVDWVSDEMNAHGLVLGRVYYPAYGLATTVPMTSSPKCGRCRPTWMPDSKRIAQPVPYAGPVLVDGDIATVFGLTIFDTHGESAGFLGAPGWVAGPSSWSPDGKAVIVMGTVETGGGHLREQPQLVDATTTQVRGTVPSALAYWVGNDRVLFLEGNVTGTWHGQAVTVANTITLRRLDGTVLRAWSVPGELYGQLTHL